VDGEGSEEVERGEEGEAGLALGVEVGRGIRSMSRSRSRTGVGLGWCGSWVGFARSPSLKAVSPGGREGGTEVLGEVELDSAGEEGARGFAGHHHVAAEVVVAEEEMAFALDVVGDGGVAGVHDSAGVVGELEAAAAREDGLHGVHAGVDVGAREPEAEGLDRGARFGGDVAEGELAGADVGEDLGGDGLGGIERAEGDVAVVGFFAVEDVF
jgi:hypothetical protein